MGWDQWLYNNNDIKEEFQQIIISQLISPKMVVKILSSFPVSSIVLNQHTGENQL